MLLTMNVRIVLIAGALGFAFQAMAFAPYLGLKFQNVLYAGSAGEVRDTGKADFDFRSVTPESARLKFTARTDDFRVNGYYDFGAGGELKTKGLVADDLTLKIVGRYRVEGVNVQFDGRTRHKGTRYRLKGSMTLFADYNVKVSARIKISGERNGRFVLDSRKKGKR